MNLSRSMFLLNTSLKLDRNNNEAVLFAGSQKRDAGAVMRTMDIKLEREADQTVSLSF